jgi:hypothetical protein
MSRAAHALLKETAANNTTTTTVIINISATLQSPATWCTSSFYDMSPGPSFFSHLIPLLFSYLSLQGKRMPPQPSRPWIRCECWLIYHLLKTFPSSMTFTDTIFDAHHRISFSLYFQQDTELGSRVG